MIDLKQCRNKRFTVWLQWSDSILFLSPRVRRLTEKSSALQPSVHWDHETRGSMLLKGRRQMYSPNLGAHINMHSAFQSPLIYTQARHSGPRHEHCGLRGQICMWSAVSHKRQVLACCMLWWWCRPSSSHACKSNWHAAQRRMHNDMSRLTGRLDSVFAGLHRSKTCCYWPRRREKSEQRCKKERGGGGGSEGQRIM